MSIHEFQLVLDPWLNGSGPDRYADLKANPPSGCVIREYSSDPGRLFLECRREADSRLDAIAQVVGEIRGRFGLPDADDLGIEKLWEFMGNSDSTVDLIAQLSLMAVRRAEFIGVDLEELIAFLRAAAGRDDHG